MASNQQRQVALKRKMECCDRTARRQRKNKTTGTIQCDYCQCAFYQRKQRDEHMKVHECPRCHEMALDAVGRAHKLRHQQEDQLEALQKQRQRKMDDDFVLCYVKANRVHKYRSQLDYEPDFDFIMLNYQFEKDEWLAFVGKFKRQFLDLFFGSFNCVFGQSKHDYLMKQLNAELVSYLLENGALSVRDAIDFLNILMKTVGYDDYVSVIVSYLLKKDCKIKAEWVAKAINDDELVECIKEKHTFTFNEIRNARKWRTYSPFDVKALKTFYAQLQKHFFNPNFENPFDDVLDEDFKTVQTERIRIGREKRLFHYIKEKDQLIMVTGSGFFKETHRLGSLVKMMKKGLVDLIKEYIKEMKVYAELDEELNRLIAERDGKIERCRRNAEYEQIQSQYFHEIDRYAEPDRDEQGRVVSKLYVAASMKQWKEEKGNTVEHKPTNSNVSAV